MVDSRAVRAGRAAARTSLCAKTSEELIYNGKCRIDSSPFLPSLDKPPPEPPMLRLLKKLFNPRSSRGLPDPVGGSEEDQIHLRNAHRNSITPSQSSTTTDIGSSESLRQSYWNLVFGLRPSFPPECSWLEPSDLRVIGKRAVAGGGFAEVWKGHLEGREVAIKSYRYYEQFDQRDLVCMVGHSAH